jgi:hypothetical protein
MRHIQKGQSLVRGAFALSMTLLLALGSFFAPAARAQFIGYTFPQTVTQTPATAAVCNGSNQVYNISNLGQTVHFVLITTSIGETSFISWIQGVSSGGIATPISDVGTSSFSSTNITLTAVGYYPQVQIVVNCTGTGQYRIDYAGTSASVPTAQGAALSNTVLKTIVSGGVGSAGLIWGQTFTPPFGSTQGFLTAEFGEGAGPSGSTLSVVCMNGAVFSTTQKWTLATTESLLQTFPVASQTCSQVQALYNNGGASTNIVTFTYTFTPPGFPQQFAYSNITTNTNTQAKTGPGFLHAITVNNPGSSAAVTVYDNTACSGTTIATIAPTAAGRIDFDVNFNTGLCITTTGAPNLTVSYN